VLLQHITHHGVDVIGITNYIQTTVATQMELPSYSAQGRLIMAVPASRSQSPAHLGCCELQHSQDPAGHLQYSTVAKGMGKCSHSSKYLLGHIQQNINPIIPFLDYRRLKRLAFETVDQGGYRFCITGRQHYAKCCSSHNVHRWLFVVGTAESPVQPLFLCCSFVLLLLMVFWPTSSIVWW
jgi:hypothetical protein